MEHENFVSADRVILKSTSTNRTTFYFTRRRQSYFIRLKVDLYLYFHISVKHEFSFNFAYASFLRKPKRTKEF